MSRRKLRRTFSRLLLLAPVTTLGAGCWHSTSSCEGDDRTFPQTYPLEYLRDADGGVPTGTCDEVCKLVQGTAPCSFTRSSENLPEPDQVVCEVRALCEGRRPEGLCSDGTLAGNVSTLGALFAKMAHLEAASVPAFERLADELAAHGAPARLVRAARRAAEDEVRHARAMETLALRHGAARPEVTVAPFAARSLEALAIENAVEGCVRETFGALLAAWQARGAEDAAVRESLAAIAPDELRHAELSWAIDAWALSQLSPEAQARVEVARQDAWNTLEQDAAALTVPEHVARHAGLPSRESAQHLVRELSHSFARA